MNRIACLGPKGSFSERAAAEFDPSAEIVLCPSFAAAVAALTEGKVDYAVLPVENSLGGGVMQALDLLAENDVFGEEERAVAVDHRLAKLCGVPDEAIEVVYSHEQALLQCAGYLRTHFPRAALESTHSTAESLEKLGPHAAGIVGAHVRREGVTLSEENIADDRGNFTLFLRVRRGGAKAQGSCAKVFLAAECTHEPGSLLKLLQCFDAQKLNLTRIESRPVKGQPGHYRFFIEFLGDMAEEPVKLALSAARAYCSRFKLLGAYA